MSASPSASRASGVTVFQRTWLPSVSARRSETKMSRALASVGVRVNCIAPGTIGTRAWDGAPTELREGLEAKVPFPRRFGRPGEYASLVEHLIRNDYINGHVVRLDGAIRFDPK